MNDLYNNIEHRRAISPTRIADTTAAVGQIISHANRGSATYLIATGTLADADATFTVLLEHGDASNLSDAAAVPDADLLGTEAGAAFTFTNDDEVRKLGYIGNKLYTRLTITPVGNSGNADISAIVILGSARTGPQSSQS